jgi:hypothetical protein
MADKLRIIKDFQQRIKIDWIIALAFFLNKEALI